MDGTTNYSWLAAMGLKHKKREKGERKKESCNKPFPKHAVPFTAPKGILETGCIEPTITDDKGNAGKRVKADEQPRYPVSLALFSVRF